MSKIIFFDIDGTIIDHFKKEIPKSTILALKMLQDNNHTIAIASGKGPKFIETFIPDISFNTYVALNGNYAVYKNKVISKNYLDEKSVKSFCEYCLTNDLAFVLSDENGTKTLYKNDLRIKKYYDGFSLGYPEVIEKVNDYGSFFQMSIMIENDNEKNIQEIFPEFTFVRMSKYGMNVVSNNGLKEKGIKKILEYTKYTSNDLVVFGDGLNDIGMFKLAKTSVAMGNADDKLKENATYITNHISNDGIYNACKKLNLI
ncbi:Cof subfamily protein (haloacid dehalogenase superfamily) [Bacilli bacterium PM5-3]|nr:Cof subfamily protein (haloacid dehalogenase superfamily) [Bacilli bacterium PM5-3]